MPVISSSKIRLTPGAAALAALCALASAQSAPPSLDFPEEIIKKGLMSTHVQQIEKWVDYHVDQFAKADKEDDVLKARTLWFNTYSQYDVPDYRYTFARALSARLAPLLDKDLPLKRVKDVNIAMAIASMPQVTTATVLGRMAAHPDAAVRYLAWQGYLAIRMRVLEQTQQNVNAMFDAVSEAASREASPQVMAMIFQMLDLSAPAPNPSVEGTYRQAQQKALDLLQQTWRRHCRQVLAGQTDAIDPCRAGVTSLVNMAGAFADDKAVVKKVLQLVMDMTWCGAEAYEQAGDKVEAARTCGMLLRDCENAMAGLSKRSKKLIDEALTDLKIKNRPAFVKLAVLKWIDELKDFGVQKPVMEHPPTTGAATTQASQP